MHLNDIRLLEPNEIEQQHINDCKDCSSRLKTLLTIRTKLANASTISAQSESWQLIKQAHSESVRISVALRTKQQTRNWRFTSLALAASLLLAVIWNVSIDEKTDLIEQQNLMLAQLMEDNHILQQKYHKFVEISNRERDEIIQWQLALNDIDIELQYSYLNASNSPEKIALWRKRQQFIKKILATKNLRTLKI